nr:MAG TPA: hypothetical protein [Caudoviricetes sp.]DAQ54485.1 MAG TPA: hypothetical protein [Caudoviricetes sp.]
MHRNRLPREWLRIVNVAELILFRIHFRLFLAEI